MRGHSFEVFEKASPVDLKRVFSEDLILETIVAYGRKEKRLRRLPALVVVYVIVFLAIYRDLSIPNALRRMSGALSAFVDWISKRVPHNTSLAQARDRLGWEVLRDVFVKFAQTHSTRFGDADDWKGHKVQALDGTVFRLTDTPENEAAFGRPGQGNGKVHYPQMRSIVLFGVRSHLIYGVAHDRYAVQEISLTTGVADQIPPNSVLLIDKAYCSYAFLAFLSKRGAYFVVRQKKKTGLRLANCKPIRNNTGDCSAEAEIPDYLLKKLRNSTGDVLPNKIKVRVIRAKRRGFRPIVLVTNLLDSERYSAAEITELFAERWQAELGLRELKCELTAHSITLRSKTPLRARQDLYGLLIAFNALRALMAEAAEQAGVKACTLSFTACFRRFQDAVPELAYGSRDVDQIIAQLVADFATYKLRARSPRRNPRVVKGKPQRYPRKKAA